MLFRALFFILVSFAFSSCGGSGSTSDETKVIEDLPFAKVETAKEYSDLVLKAIKTNRGKVLYTEFESGVAINQVKFNRIVSMFSTGIGGRKDWKYYDFHQLSGSTDQTAGFDYAWLDPKGRLGIQLFIKPKHDGTKFYIDHIDFRSRIDVIDSVSFPTGEEIDDYKKVSYDWDEDAKKK